MKYILSSSYETVCFLFSVFFFNGRREVVFTSDNKAINSQDVDFFLLEQLRIYSYIDYRVRVGCFFSSSIEVLRMQRENQQLRKTIDDLKNSGQRMIELEAENEQLQKASMEGKTTVFTLNEVRTDCNMVLVYSVLIFIFLTNLSLMAISSSSPPPRDLDSIAK